MLEWELVPERLGPQAPGWAAQKKENDTRRCRGGEFNMLQSLFVLQLLFIHRTLSNKMRGIFFLKKSSLVFIHCVNMYSAWICIWVYNTVTVGKKIWKKKKRKEEPEHLFEKKVKKKKKKMNDDANTFFYFYFHWLLSLVLLHVLLSCFYILFLQWCYCNFVDQFDMRKNGTLV